MLNGILGWHLTYNLINCVNNSNVHMEYHSTLKNQKVTVIELKKYYIHSFFKVWGLKYNQNFKYGWIQILNPILRSTNIFNPKIIIQI